MKTTYPNSEMKSFEEKPGIKRKGSPTSSPTHKKQRFESSCYTCSTAGGLIKTSTDVAPADNTVQKKLREHLKSVREDKLTYVRGGGKEKACSNKYMNISFMEDYFPEAFKTPYHWPLRFDFKHASYSTEYLGKVDPKGQFGSRKGDEAEHKTFHMLAEMFKQKNVPTFIISRYIWMKMFPKELLRVLKEELLKDKIREGESDLLIFLPNRGVLALEVKSKVNTKDKRSMKKVIEEGFSVQCTKALEFVVNASIDLTDNVNYILMKVMSFPNCSRSDIESLFCQNCSEHFITEDDLQSINNLYKWFVLLLEKYNTKFLDVQFNSEVYKGIISRLLGPNLRVDVERVINDTHEEIEKEGSIESNETKWVQLNREQGFIASKNPHFLWLTGVPGSGKTILGCWKVENILQNPIDAKHIIYLIAGNKDLLFIEKMKMWLKSRFVGEKGKFDLKLEAIDDIFERSHQYKLIGILNVVEKLKKKHEDCELSIIKDEFRILDQNKSEQRMKKLSNLGIKNMWVILNPFSSSPENSVLTSLGFEIGHLNHVMRMSIANLNFVNHWLGQSYKIGHCINGLIPKIYKMKCICDDLPIADFHNCTPLLISKLTEYVYRELGRADEADDLRFEMKEVVIMTREHASVKKLLSKSKINVTVRPAAHFNGCEAKIAIVDFRHIHDVEHTLTEALTRATSRLVIFDVICKHDENQDKNQDKVHRMLELLTTKTQSAKDLGLLEMENVELEGSEKKVMRYELSLGLFRDEDEVKQNMAQMVTVGKLDVALDAKLAPIKKDISKINNVTLDAKLAPIKEDISNISNVLNEIKSEMQSYGGGSTNQRTVNP